ncbi:thymidylate synthase [Methanocaldococcus villosus KIN24-T80]|uniref:Putative thymidylate synthase n=1 Tax=Methanocaldococcus villosus KIN24-T80 TaxID=1069083 RepID=N6V188_9EURY|nr:thymidylate synthase [Methanocaldococcus villosus]ENN96043.1 thymidylate synthase [Methanocaldococcus villosus KIN24-T80]
MIIKKPSVAAAYEELVHAILKHGREVITEDGQKCKELMNVLVEITNPAIKRVSPKYPFGKEAIDKYINNLLYGSNNDFVYDYHERIFKYPSYDRKVVNNQIDYVINKLKNAGTSRRAVISLWQPFIDQENKDVPCLNYINFQKREDSLYMTVVFRSNDILLAFHANALALIRLGELVAEKIGGRLKSYNHFICNAHIYVERDRDYLERW